MTQRMHKLVILSGILVLLVQPRILQAAVDKSDSNRDYLSLQLNFIDYYSNWSYFKFKVYNERWNEYGWIYNEPGCAGGYLELNIGVCWKHFLSKRVFGELSLATGVSALEKSDICRRGPVTFTKIRIPPSEYIAQAGIGYCFFQSKRLHVFAEITGSLNSLREFPPDINVACEQFRNPIFAWRGEIGIIFHLGKSSFLEIEAGLFHNSNNYHNTGHQVRLGIGKIFYSL